MSICYFCLVSVVNSARYLEADEAFFGTGGCGVGDGYCFTGRARVSGDAAPCDHVVGAFHRVGQFAAS